MPIRLRTLDRQFARYCRIGDTEALGRVFDASASELLHIAAWLGGNRADADDLLQATFLTAIENRASFVTQRRVLPWLLGILTNHARNLRRERARLAALPGRAEPIADPMAAVRDAEFATLLADARQAIGTPYSEVLALHLEEGLNANEIAARLGRPAGTVRTQVARGLELLRQRLPASSVSAFVPLLPGPATFSAIKSKVLLVAGDAATAEATAIAQAAGSAASATILTTGGVLMTKKVLVAILAGLLLLTTGFYQGWFSPGTSSGVNLPVVQGTASETEPGVTIASAQVSGQQIERTLVAQPMARTGSDHASLKVVVRWQHDGSPAIGVGVWAKIRDQGWLRRDGVTGADGTCSLGHMQSTEWIVGCTHSEREVAVAVESDSKTKLEFTAVQEATVRGNVVDTAGAAVAGAMVWIADGRGPDDRQFEVTRTNAQGWFKVPVRGRQLIGARKPGHAAALAIRVDATKGDRDVVLRMRGAAAIVRGFVSDPEGKPIASARVAVGPYMQLSGIGGPQSDLVEAYGKQVVTGEDGAFEFASVMPEPGRLWVWAAGFAPNAQSLVPKVGQPYDIDVEMRLGASVAGTIRGEQGKPLAGARIGLSRHSGLWLTANPTATSDANGEFEVRDLPDGPMSFVVRANPGPGTATAELQLVAGQRIEWNPSIGAGRTIRGVLLDQDSNPMGSVQIGFVTGMATHPARFETTDSNGRFTLSNVGDEPVQVEVGDIYHEPLRSLPDIAPGTNDLEIRIRHKDLPTARIRGRFIDEAGSAIQATIGVPSYRGMKRIRDVTTDGLGAFELGPIRAGPRQLKIYAGDLGPVLIDPIVLETDQTMDLGTITVRRPGSATFAAFDEKGDPLVSCLVYLSEMAHPHRSVGGTKIVNGLGRIDAVPPGRWRVITNKRGFGATEITIESGSNAHLELRAQ